MSTSLIILVVAVAAGIAGIMFGWFLRFITSLGKKGSMELEIREMMLGAREEADKVVSKAEREAQDTLKEVRTETKDREDLVRKNEQRLIEKESYLDKRQIDLDGKESSLQEERDTLGTKQDQISQLKEKLETELANLSHLSSQEAKEKLFKTIEEDFSEDILIRLKKLEQTGEVKMKEKARDILSSTIQRLSLSIPHETFSTTVNISNNNVKGKVIGKDGRNIKTFERISGVELIIDDTPGIITISSFDPIRREVARRALEELISDGRIQPVRIEGHIKRAQEEVDRTTLEKGEEAAYECGVFNLDQKLLSILGQLYFRTSYGQNVLAHSVEMAHIAGMLAEEIGADSKVAKTAALLHDIGKVSTHETSGTHIEIGTRILQKYEVDQNIIDAVATHHDEMEAVTPEAVIVQVADSISGGRPGARREAVDDYINRLTDLESIATTIEGVKKAYALQAGREIRVFVSPEEVSDLEAKKLAQKLARQIEEELTYPGEILVTVIRENRVVEHAR